MRNITLLTGAGASVPFGYPITTEFFAESGSEWVIEPRQLHDLTKSYLGAGKHLPDVEDYLGLLDPVSGFFQDTEAGRYLAFLVDSRMADPLRPLSDLIAAAAEEIKQRCHKLYGKAPDKHVVGAHYEPLLDLLGWQAKAVPWFTTNYDRTAQTMLRVAHDRGLGRADGFVVNNEYNRAEFKSITKGLKVYRLHGAIHWFVEDEVFKDQVHGGFREGRRSFIPPGFKGDPREDADGPHKDAHVQFEKELSKADLFVVIGFSFRDSTLNKILYEAIGGNPGLRVISINPNFPNHEFAGWPELTTEYGDRIILIKKKFGEVETIEELRDEISKLR